MGLTGKSSNSDITSGRPQRWRRNWSGSDRAVNRNSLTTLGFRMTERQRKFPNPEMTELQNGIPLPWENS